MLGSSLSVSRLLIAAVVFRGIVVVVADTAPTGNDQHAHRHELRPRFLNGHYIVWPRRKCNAKRVDGWPHADGNVEDCDGDEADARPPPYVYYAPDNVIFTRMQMAGDRAFIVSPRYKPGVPFTLSYVPLTDCASSASGVETRDKWCGRDLGSGFYPVTPYPSLRAHCQFAGRPAESVGGGPTLCDKESLINVVDAHLGPDGVLWVLDVGVVDTLHRSRPADHGKPIKYNDPRVLGIDVATGNTVHKITLEKLLPVRESKKRTVILARRLRTIVVEYEYTGENESAARSDETPVRIKTEYKIDSNSSDSIYSSSAGINSSKGSNNGDSQRAAKPVAVYVGDATADCGAKGSILVWFVEADRGIRVTLPPSVSAATGPVDSPTAVDDRDDYGTDADGFHMALLDDPARTTDGDSGPRRHLYFTYGRHPDAFRIPISVFRHRHRRVADELRLTNCNKDLRFGSGGGGGNRCVTNVGAKPVGQDDRPLVPVDSAHGFLWYFRDDAAAAAVLFAWDSRRPFLRENFEQVRGRSTSPAVRDGCSCDGHAADRPESEKTGKGDEVAGGREHDGDVEENDDEDDEPCDSCDVANNKTEPSVLGHQRQPRSTTFSGCLQVTSVDHACSTAAEGSVDDGPHGTLWALHTNVRDWLRGRTGRFGTTALLCPVLASPCGGDDH